MAKPLTIDEANEYLSRVAMRLGDWNQIAYGEGADKAARAFKRYQAPRSASELFSYSRHIAACVPTGSWKIFQIDNSAYLDRDQFSMIGSLLVGPDHSQTVLDTRSWLFEFGNDNRENQAIELQIANLLFAFLLFESHAYLVSSSSIDGQLLGVQDGFIYFIARDPQELSVSDAIVAEYERNPLMSPEWVTKAMDE